MRKKIEIIRSVDSQECHQSIFPLLFSQNTFKAFQQMERKLYFVEECIILDMGSVSGKGLKGSIYQVVKSIPRSSAKVLTSGITSSENTQSALPRRARKALISRST